MSGPAFLITRDTDAATTPEAARARLRSKRGDTSETLVGALETAEAHAGDLVKYIPAGSQLDIADDAVVMMIGNTPELVAAIDAAADRSAKRRITQIEAATQPDLATYYARISVSVVQTDTVCLIGSFVKYWANVARGTGWQALGSHEPYLSLVDDGSGDDTNHRLLHHVVRYVKNNG